MVRVLGSVIQAFVLAVLDAGRDLLLRSPIAGQLVGDHHARRPALPLQQLSEQAFGGPFVPPALHQNVEHLDILQEQTSVYRCEPGERSAGDYTAADHAG